VSPGSRATRGYPGSVGMSLLRRRQTFEDEFLHAIALRLARHDVALWVDVQAVEVEELARLAPRPSDMANLLERRAVENCDALVRTVGDVEEALFRIGRQADAECRAGALRFPLDESLFDEFAI